MNCERNSSSVVELLRQTSTLSALSTKRDELLAQLTTIIQQLPENTPVGLIENTLLSVNEAIIKSVKCNMETTEVFRMTERDYPVDGNWNFSQPMNWTLHQIVVEYCQDLGLNITTRSRMVTQSVCSSYKQLEHFITTSW